MFFFGCVAPFTSDESPFSRRCRGFHENPFWSVFQFCDGHKTPHVSLVIVSVRCLGFFPLSLQKKRAGNFRTAKVHHFLRRDYRERCFILSRAWVKAKTKTAKKNIRNKNFTDSLSPFDTKVITFRQTHVHIH